MSRDWHAASDLDAYPYEDYEDEQGIPRDDSWWLAPADLADMPRHLRRAEESPRRQKLFRRAEATMRVMVAMRGVYGSNPTITAWYGRHGRRLGLFTFYDDNYEIQWTPRLGFRVLEIQDIPF